MDWELSGPSPPSWCWYEHLEIQLTYSSRYLCIRGTAKSVKEYKTGRPITNEKGLASMNPVSYSFLGKRFRINRTSCISTEMSEVQSPSIQSSSNVIVSLCLLGGNSPESSLLSRLWWYEHERLLIQWKTAEESYINRHIDFIDKCLIACQF